MAGPRPPVSQCICFENALSRLAWHILRSAFTVSALHRDFRHAPRHVRPAIAFLLSLVVGFLLSFGRFPRVLLKRPCCPLLSFSLSLLHSPSFSVDHFLFPLLSCFSLISADQLFRMSLPCIFLSAAAEVHDPLPLHAARSDIFPSDFFRAQLVRPCISALIRLPPLAGIAAVQ